MAPLAQVLAIFSMLSLLAIGGGAAVLPEMRSLTVGPEPWLTAAQFGQLYSLGQLAPGPNMLMVGLIGARVAGLAGGVLAVVGFFLPSSLLAFFAGRVWDRFADHPLRRSTARGLGPVIVGLMLAGAGAIERTVMTGHGVLPYAIAAAVTAILAVARPNPFWLILAGGGVSALAALAGP